MPPHNIFATTIGKFTGDNNCLLCYMDTSENAIFDSFAMTNLFRQTQRNEI